MKKRIISLILVVVIAALSLVSCGYSIANDDLSAHAVFGDAQKTAFEKALGELKIEDGEFTSDPATRENKLWDEIYSALATAAKNNSDNKKTEGTMGTHDLFYYNYYCTAVIGEKEVVLFAGNMKSGDSNMGSAQLGLMDPTTLEAAISAAVTGKDIKDYAYSTETSGDLAVGDVLYISYTYTYQVSAGENTDATTTKTVSVENERIVLDPTAADAHPLVAHLLTKEEGATSYKYTLSSTIDNPATEIDGKAYTGIKINWRVKSGAELATVTDTTYTETKSVKDVYGDSYDIKDVALTYHIYPVYFYSVSEYDASAILNDIAGADLTATWLMYSLYGIGYADLTEDEQKAVLDEYKTTDLAGKELSFEAFIEELVKLQEDLETSKKNLDSAKTDLETKQISYDEYKDKYDKNPDDATVLDSYNKALENLNTAKTALDTAQSAYDTDVKERDDKLALLYAMKDGAMKTNIEDGYAKFVFDSLVDEYNEEVKMNVAKAIYDLMIENVSVVSVPEEALEQTYEQMLENYEYDFYKGDSTTQDPEDSSKKLSNYRLYNGDFKAYLKVTVGDDIRTVTDYDDALKAIREKAEEYVKPVVAIYVLAKSYGVLVSDSEFEDYKDDPENLTISNIDTYGEESVRYAHQFDKLMNHILSIEEKDFVGENGARSYKYYQYSEKIKFVFEKDATEDAE